MSGDDPRQIGGALDAAVERVRRAAAARSARAAEPDVEREQRQRDAARRARADRFSAACPARFRDAQLDRVAASVRADLLSWASSDDPPNLVLAGPVGVGKTYAAIAAVRQRVLDGDRARLCSVGQLLDELRPGGPEGALDAACSISLLLLDDLGSERPTDWTAERLALVIDSRWREQRATIATTNLTLGPSGELIAAIGERSYSRLVGSDALVLWLDGDDRRRTR